MALTIPPNLLDANLAPSAAAAAPAQIQPKPASSADKTASLKSKISNMMEDSRADDSVSRTPVADDSLDPFKPPAIEETAQSPSASAQITPGLLNEPPKDFKTLKAALDARDVNIAALTAELDKARPSAARVTELEAQIESSRLEVEETKQWRSRFNLLRSDEFQNTIVLPRQQLAMTIKAELASDGVDETLWEQAMASTSRKELETLVNDNIDSDLLRTQFYNLFFQDLELRKREGAALEAPAKYMETVQAEETSARNQRQAQTLTGFQATWQDALSDATIMMDKLGDNKLIETVMIQGNTEHNEKVVKPILDAAHQGAEAALKERIALGLPVNRQIAAQTVYLWRQAVAAQAANQDRMRWFREAQGLQKQVTDLTAKLERKSAVNNPTPGARAPGASSGGSGKFQRGKDLAATIANFRNSEAE